MDSHATSPQSPTNITLAGNIFFYCSGYQHLSICLAEGFKELGIPFYSNINYWKISPEREEYLFCYDSNVTPDDCSIVVIDKNWIFSNQPFPEDLFHSARQYITVYLDDMDGPSSPFSDWMSDFDFIFRTHLNKRTQNHRKFIPWAFGLSNRILRETRDIPNFQQRKNSLLDNFRVSQEQARVGNWWVKVDQGMLLAEQGVIVADHPIRPWVRNHFFPLIRRILPVEEIIDNFDDPPSDSYHYLQWEQTGHRHYPNYYKRLKEFVACAGFGGWMVPSSTSQETFVEWWDSWRFWESLAAGCVTFHVDFDKYGITLPVMPENWRHYIGIDLDDIQSTVERITSDLGILEKISTEGRRWAIENYGPIPTAIRFLKTISSMLSYGSSTQESLKIKGNQALFQPMVSLSALLPLKLGEVNLIIFPDWSQSEESLFLELERVIRAIMTHPDRHRLTLLIVTSNITEEDANLILSSVTMNFLLQENLDVSEGLEISLIGNLEEIQWKALLPRLQARIILENQNQQLIAQAKAETILAYELESFIDKQVDQFFFELGNKLFQERRWQEAINQYQKVLKLKIGDADLYWHLSECFKQINLLNEAFSTLREGIQLYPNEGGLHFALVINLQGSGRLQEAISNAVAASDLLPDDYTFKILKNLILPIVYDTQDEISFYRQRFIRGLNDLVQQTSLKTPEEQRNALAGIGRFTNFYLSYQAYNDIELQRQYGNLVHQIMGANYPHWVTPLSMPPLKENNKIRIGYVSAYLHSYSGTLWLTGWLRHCDQQSFEIYCYYIGNEPDAITQKFQEYSNVFHHIPHNLEAACEQITADQLHILVFPEIGMNPQTMQMAALRLAPVQCVAWGHPVTSGLPTIDYFLSSELMEPENAQEHYSETLIRLPNIGVSYPKPSIPPKVKTRSDFQLGDDAVIYLCCQAPFKYLPQYDFIFAEIARRVPQAQFVFLRGSLLKPRLNRAFAAVELDSKDYCVFLTVPERLDYLMINLLSDVYLDTFSWSGGNTTLEAIACSLPVVTCPGEFMRGRHSDSFLRMLGVTDTITENEAEYIEFAVRLGLDPSWRGKIAARMSECHDLLYDDTACVVGLEAFYKQVVQKNLMQSN